MSALQWIFAIIAIGLVVFLITRRSKPATERVSVEARPPNAARRQVNSKGRRAPEGFFWGPDDELWEEMGDMIVDIAIIAQILGDQFVQDDYPEYEEVELVEPAEHGPIIESSDLPDALAKNASMPVGSESIASAPPIAPAEEPRMSPTTREAFDGERLCRLVVDGGSDDSGDSGGDCGDDD